MKKINLKRDELKEKIFLLMDEVSNSLKKEPDVDKFLDKTDVFDFWESILPDDEYPIFVMAVLNNIKKESILDIILESVEKSLITPSSTLSSNVKQEPFRTHNGEHPFS